MNKLVDPKQSRMVDSNTAAGGIGHVNLRVADLHRATDFYRNVLGLTVTYYGPDIGLPAVFLAYGDYHRHVALHWFYSDSHTPTPVRQSGLNHFALVYPNELSLAAAVARLRKHRVPVEDACDHGSTLSIYLRDLDDNRIELYYDRPRTQWFDSMSQLIIQSVPFDVEKWLEDVEAGAREAASR